MQPTRWGRWGLLIFGIALYCAPLAARPAIAPPTHTCYIWQRAWTPAVLESLHATPAAITGLAIQLGELRATDSSLDWVGVAPDWDALAASGRPVTLVIRLVVPAARLDDITRTALIARFTTGREQAARAGIAACAVQLDFDCPTADLPRYATFLRPLRAALRPGTFSITSLPAWLDAPRLATPVLRAAGHHALQVHSIQRPDPTDPALSLCHVPSARRWIGQAARIGVLFEVVLPTYGYLVARDAEERIIGLVAEQEIETWPAETATIERLMPDAPSLAALVAELEIEQPRGYRGIAWYRLPSATDTHAWPWSTLSEVMAGRTPAPAFRITLAESAPGLYDLTVANAGTLEGRFSTPVAITASAPGPERPWWDALEPGAIAPAAANRLEWSLPEGMGVRLGPGESRALGWVRWDDAKGVSAHAMATTQ